MVFQRRETVVSCVGAGDKTEFLKEANESK